MKQGGIWVLKMKKGDRDHPALFDLCLAPLSLIPAAHSASSGLRCLLRYFRNNCGKRYAVRSEVISGSTFFTLPNVFPKHEKTV